MILYLSRLVFELGLSIQESSVTRLQDQSGSIFLITGPLEQLRKLSDRLEGESHFVLEGEVISPYKVFDLTLNVPDRNGLILDLCTTLKEYKVNIKSQTSFVYPDLDDLWWAHIRTRVEVTRERLSDMERMERELDEMCRKAYEDQFPETASYLDLSGWLVTLRERQGGGTDSP
jgi:glycine cleavage system regulatory protein